jgi:hypothetical protein
LVEVALQIRRIPEIFAGSSAFDPAKATRHLPQNTGKPLILRHIASWHAFCSLQSGPVMRPMTEKSEATGCNQPLM